MDRHALFAVTTNGNAFRVGKPTTWDNAQERWSRAADRQGGFNGHRARPCTVLGFAGSYPVAFFEVRSTDKRGVGQGSLRHEYAVAVPHRALRTALRPR